MKRLIILFTLLSSLLMATLLSGHQVQAATTQVTLEHTLNAANGTTRPGVGARFEIYDVTAASQNQSTVALAHELGAKDDQAIAAYIAAKHLPKLRSVETDQTGSAYFTVEGSTQSRYLVVQTTPGVDAGDQRAMPIVFSPTRADQIQGLTLVTKPVAVQPAVYFYKYAKGVDIPLAGAVFVLRRGVDQYLSPDGQWHQSKNPRSDPDVMRVTSDHQGLVLLTGMALLSGRYEMQEVQAPSGYQITTASQHVAVVIPQTGTNAAITVNGAALRPLLADQVQAGEAARQALRVYNVRPSLPQTPGDGQPPITPRPLLPQTPGDEQPPQTPSGPSTPPRRNLPDTGEVKISLAIVGLLIIGIALLLWKKGNDIQEEKHEK
ncbi:SpaA isopeptide-forming pilin-related protein [Lacticaseibacillus sp. N501-2]|uniref:SpaA isopeptide-forming pilin-related protein n=1 Tax=Lacticaseibacillus salsurae TaxID=3367729 RepID=UPI0038B271ED